MEFATLNIRTRPLRFVYLVSDMNDVLKAIKLFTHLWGGAANPILPLPKNANEIECFKIALKSINPDYIIIPDNNLSTEIIRILKKEAVLYSCIADELINKCTENPVGLQWGTELSTGVWTNSLFMNKQTINIFHILQTIYSNTASVPQVNIVDLEDRNDWNRCISVQQGIFSNNYKENYLKQHLKANILSYPDSVLNLIKIGFLLNNYQTPLTLTKAKLNYLYSHFYNLPSPTRLNIFLEDACDLRVLSAFWNSNMIPRFNRLILPKKEFINQIDSCMRTILEIMPYISDLSIFAAISEQEAQNINKEIQLLFNSYQRNIIIEFNHSNFGYKYEFYDYYCQKNTISQPIGTDKSVRLNPSTLQDINNLEFLFAYDAEIFLSSGRKIILPRNMSTAMLLSNNAETIKYYDSISKKADLQNISYTRGNIKEINSIIFEGGESRFYIPEAKDLIVQRIDDSGFKIKLNKHTRYAQGFIKRFGGFKRAITLIDKLATEIISIFYDRQTMQARGGGYSTTGITFDSSKHCLFNRLKNKYNLPKQDCKLKKQEFKDKLEFLVKNKLLIRGYNFQCPHCNLSDWLSLNRIEDFIECRGCAESFLLPLFNVNFAYKLNDSLDKLVNTEGLAILMTANILNKIYPYSWIDFGGNLYKNTEDKNIAEVDLCCLSDDRFIIAECKSIHRVDTEKIEIKIQELQQQINNLVIRIASQIECRAIFIGIITDIVDSNQILEKLQEIVEESKKSNIGIHIIINWELFLWGENVPRKINSFSINDLFAEHSCFNEDCIERIEVSSFSERIIPLAELPVDSKLLNTWMGELKKSK